jgi:hypothetical protein
MHAIRVIISAQCWGVRVGGAAHCGLQEAEGQPATRHTRLSPVSTASPKCFALGAHPTRQSGPQPDPHRDNNINKSAEDQRPSAQSHTRHPRE